MAVTGTTDFLPTLDDIVEEAFERAGREARTGYDFRTARRSLNLLLLEWANAGYNLWTVEEVALALVAGTDEYTLGADTVDVLDVTLRVSATQDRFLERMHLNTYARLSNKALQGAPTRYFIKREVAAPKMILWPVPDANATDLVYWRVKRIDDAGDGANTQAVPFRFLPALIAGLALKIAQKYPEGQNKLQYLAADYQRVWDDAAYEDRDRSSVRIRPRIR